MSQAKTHEQTAFRRSMDFVCGKTNQRPSDSDLQWVRDSLYESVIERIRTLEQMKTQQKAIEDAHAQLKIAQKALADAEAHCKASEAREHELITKCARQERLLAQMPKISRVKPLASGDLLGNAEQCGQLLCIDIADMRYFVKCVAPRSPLFGGKCVTHQDLSASPSAICATSAFADAPRRSEGPVETTPESAPSPPIFEPVHRPAATYVEILKKT